VRQTTTVCLLATFSEMCFADNVRLNHWMLLWFSAGSHLISDVSNRMVSERQVILVILPSLHSL